MWVICDHKQDILLTEDDKLSQDTLLIVDDMRSQDTLLNVGDVRSQDTLLTVDNTRVVPEVPDLTKKKTFWKKMSLFLYIVSF
jgi:hypothetical protein